MTQTAQPTSGAAASPGAAQPTQGNGLDELLREFDQPADGQPPADPITRIVRAFKPVADYVAEEREAKVVDSVKQGVKEAVAFLGEAEETKAIPEFWRKAFLEEYALQNPSVTESFNNRASDPQAWKTELGKARSMLLEKASGLPQSNIRADVEAAAAAVAGRSNQAIPDKVPSPMEMRNMSDLEFQNLKDREAAKARS